MAIFVNKDSLSEKDIEKFLLVCLFGSRYNTIKTDREKIALAIRRAYRDFCRTIRKRKGDINDGIYIDLSFASSQAIIFSR